MTAPGELAAALERSDLPPGEGERFAGYGIMAQPFRSGHVLALRRFAHTSIGAGCAGLMGPRAAATGP